MYNLHPSTCFCDQTGILDVSFFMFRFEQTLESFYAASFVCSVILRVTPGYLINRARAGGLYRLIIACNACQLLATNLPVCHSRVCAPSVGLSIPVLSSLFFYLVVFRFHLVFKLSSNLVMSSVGKCPK